MVIVLKMYPTNRGKRGKRGKRDFHHKTDCGEYMQKGNLSHEENIERQTQHMKGHYQSACTNGCMIVGQAMNESKLDVVYGEWAHLVGVAGRIGMPILCCHLARRYCVP